MPERIRGVAVNMSPCRGEDRRFESGRVRLRLAEALLRRDTVRYWLDEVRLQRDEVCQYERKRACEGSLA